MSKIAVLFPGIGYHTDKPLLYFSRKLAKSKGYEIIEVNYGGFPAGVKGSAEKMKEAYVMALSQAEEILTGVDFSKYEDVLFISKSVGTAVAASYDGKYSVGARHIYYTPVVESFQFMREKSGVVFHGTGDSWADTAAVRNECKRLDLPLHITLDASHSLEVSDIFKDFDNLKVIMGHTEEYMQRWD